MFPATIRIPVAPVLPDFELKRGDRLPGIEAAIDAPPGSLLGATSYRFEFWPVSTPLRRRGGVATLVDGADNILQYLWQPGDTDLAGDYQGEWKVTYGQLVTTYPASGYMFIRINP